MFVLLKVQSLQLSFRPAGVSLGGGGARPPSAPPPPGTPLTIINGPPHDENVDYEELISCILSLYF